MSVDWQIRIVYYNLMMRTNTFAVLGTSTDSARILIYVNPDLSVWEMYGEANTARWFVKDVYLYLPLVASIADLKYIEAEKIYTMFD